jgi:CDP-paratose 2-epimerase
LVSLLEKQFEMPKSDKPRIVNLGGGPANAMSLAQLSKWCEGRFGSHPIASDTAPRPFDVPWLAMDSRLAEKAWDWRPKIKLETILDEIARHAQAHPHWLEISSAL